MRPLRSTVIGTAFPAGTAAISLASWVAAVTGLPSNRRTTSRGFSFPSDGMPGVTASTSSAGCTSYPSSRRAAAIAESWERIISTCPSWASCCCEPPPPYWTEKG